jgi:outer membrane biosynthesis protein TonB
MPPRRDDRDDRQLHVWSSAGLAGVVVLLAVGLYHSRTLSAETAERGPNLDELEAIEASIAYKQAEPQKQPQKQKRAPEPEVEPEGVSRDPDRPPDPQPPKDEPTKKDDPPPLDWRKFQRPSNEDLDVGQPVDDPGVFDPNAPPGWATETKGDPYFRKLVSDLRDGWEYPEILGAEGVPVGCMRLERDGRVTDTLLRERSGNPALDDSAERALKALEKQRSKNPPAVPDHLLKQTTRWICFKFEV